MMVSVPVLSVRAGDGRDGLTRLAAGARFVARLMAQTNK